MRNYCILYKPIEIHDSNCNISKSATQYYTINNVTSPTNTAIIEIQLEEQILETE